MANQQSIKALVSLIDDPDENIFQHVRDEIINVGTSAIPFLENSWENNEFGLLFQTRVESLIHKIQFNGVRDELQSWIKSSDKDLLKGAVILNKFQYPNLDDEKIFLKIQEIRKDIWLELNDHQTAYEKIRIFNKIFYNKYHFKGNSKDFHAPANSLISDVLETRKGNPLSLSIIYSTIAQSLDMPVYGVNLPNHFILAYLDENGVNAHIGQENEFGVLFYINAFTRGGIFDDSEIRNFLKGINKPELREYFEPCSNSAMLQRIITNLINAFQQVGNKEKVDELIELRSLFNLEF